MPTEPREQTLFEDAVRVPAWLYADRATPFAERVRRDRAIARDLPAGDDLARVRAWRRRILDDPAQRRDDDPGLGRARGLVTALMLLIGVLAGAGVAVAALRYDGTHPVNVITALGLLLGVQLALLALALVLLPGRALGLRSLQDLAAAINPGLLTAAFVSRRLGQRAEALFGWNAGRSAAARRFTRWQLLAWSQAAAVAFNVSALVCATLLVAFTDIAFGWSTTIETHPRTVHALATAMAWPWQGWLPQALPGMDLIAQSQFFRLEGAARGAAPAALGGWWPFLLMSLVCYGLVPRVALLALAIARLRAATVNLLLGDAQVSALLERMRAPAVETTAAEPETGARSPVAPLAHAALPDAGAAHAVIWGGSLDPGEAEAFARTRLGFSVPLALEAGGGRTLEADRETLQKIGNGKPRAVLVLPRAFEAPMLEFLDFLAALRARLGAGVPVVVVPVPEAGESVNALQRETWSEAVARLGDAGTYVETGAQ